eukprot:scaffold137773_cov124-Phaeocystis_antarctica.AAC.1
MPAAVARPITNSAAPAALASCQGAGSLFVGYHPSAAAVTECELAFDVTALVMLTLTGAALSALSLC